MASYNRSYKAGETKGQTQEKTNQAMGAMKDTAQAAKDKTYNAAQAAKDKTQGAAQGTKDKTEGAAQGTKEKTQASKDQAGSYVSEKAGVTKEKAMKTTEAAKQNQSAREAAVAGKDKSADVLGKTGEQIKNMAQGAADAVKNTFGMADIHEDDPTKTSS